MDKTMRNWGVFSLASVLGLFLTGHAEGNCDIVWVEQSGTIGEDSGHSVAVGPDGNVYATDCASYDFRTSVDPSPGGNDMFLAKHNEGGSLQSNTFLGSWASGSDNSLAVDIRGVDIGEHVYVAARASCPFGTSVDADSGGNDMFLAKYHRSGVHQWNTFPSAARPEDGTGLVLGADGNGYVTGYADGSLDGGDSLGIDLFLSKHDSDCLPISIDQFGAIEGNYGLLLALGAEDGVYMCRRTYGLLGEQIGGGSNAFVVKTASRKPSKILALPSGILIVLQVCPLLR